MFIASVLGFLFGIKVAFPTGLFLLRKAKWIDRCTGYYSNHMVISPVLIILFTILSIIVKGHDIEKAMNYPYDGIGVVIMLSPIIGFLLPFIFFWLYALFKDFQHQLAIKIGGLLLFIALIVFFFTGQTFLTTALFTLFFTVLQYYHYKHYH